MVQYRKPSVTAVKRYPRTELARSTADIIEGRGLFDEGRDGLLLAAPRRTGKTTFLVEDLRPEMLKRGHAVVYVDLWQNLKADPADVIDGAIGKAVRERLGGVAKATLAAGVESLDIAGVMKIDTTRIGKYDGASLAEALAALREVSSGSIVLMVDEAQHALTSTGGADTMTALKSARDQMNSPDDVNLRLVMTGSDRDKLSRLVNTHDAPFLGSRITDLPLLGEGFVAFVADRIEHERPDLAPIDARGLGVAFSHFGNRPKLFERAISDALNPLAEADGRFEGRVLEFAAAHREREREDQRALWHGLRPLERAIVWRMLDTRERFRPFDGDALAFYDEVVGTESPVAKPTTRSQVQNALARLRAHDPPLIWKSVRGEYTVADASMQDWYVHSKEIGRWPPPASE